ncbi:lasso peptide biosynthesis B2 protein (plasmid) [Streptomyces olivoreticuli]|uniref:lasso peptide biosynthesis B2 protein n=1 Tax=Streptomyces olivoreticuli TaxID=68246 RepID=UPI00265A91A3|nr:lasso peptide biosynthesis B2 protein [Streptomyces olivoreticuli]WKK27841.1 lasso peptide biosynthesis B2 protein [Streptomyces olivoreticuli]
MLTTPEGVHHASCCEGTAILDARSGRWVMLDDADASRIWQAVIARGTADGLAREIAAWCGTDEAAIAPAVASTVEKLVARGLLIEASGHEPPTATGNLAQQQTATVPVPERVPILFRALAVVALAVALVVLRLPLRVRVRVVRVVSRLPYATPGDLGVLHAAVLSVRPPWWRGRLACMETSMTVVVAAALLGRRAQWVLGARFLPHAAHAWAEVPGGAVGRDGQDSADRPWMPVLTT